VATVVQQVSRDRLDRKDLRDHRDRRARRDLLVRQDCLELPVTRASLDLLGALVNLAKSVPPEHPEFRDRQVRVEPRDRLVIAARLAILGHQGPRAARARLVQLVRLVNKVSRVHLAFKDQLGPVDYRGILGLPDSVESRAFRDQREPLDRLVHRASRVSLVIRAKWDIPDLQVQQVQWGQLAILDSLETKVKLDNKVELEPQVCQVQWVMLVYRERVVVLVPLVHPDRVDLLVQQDLLALSELQDMSVSREHKEPKAFWVLPDQPDPLVISVNRDTQDTLDRLVELDTLEALGRLDVWGILERQELLETRVHRDRLDQLEPQVLRVSRDSRERREVLDLEVQMDLSVLRELRALLELQVGLANQERQEQLDSQEILEFKDKMASRDGQEHLVCKAILASQGQRELRARLAPWATLVTLAIQGHRVLLDIRGPPASRVTLD
jgi:hypothetical protein